MTSSSIARTGRALAVTPWRSMAEVVEEMTALVHLNHAYPDLGGLPTGIASLDRLISHTLTPGHLVVVAADTGGGKSAFVQQLAEQFAQPTDVPSLTREDPETDAAMRMAANVSRTDLGRIRSGFSGDEGIPQSFYYAAEHMAKLRLDTVDRMAMSVEKVIIMAMDWMVTKNVGRGSVLIVDQLSHLVPSDPAWWADKKNDFIPRPPRQGAAETTWLKWQTHALKVAAQSLGLIVVLVHQLNENAGAGRPGLSSMSGSRGINQEADLILLPWRPREAPEGFGDPLGGAAAPRPTRTADGEAFIICPKSRHGLEFEIPVHWVGAQQRFAAPDVNVKALHALVAPRSALAIEGESRMDALRRQLENTRQLRLAAAEQEMVLADKLMAADERKAIAAAPRARNARSDDDDYLWADNARDDATVWETVDGVVVEPPATTSTPSTPATTPTPDIVDADVVEEDVMAGIPKPRVLSHDEYAKIEARRAAAIAARTAQAPPPMTAPPAQATKFGTHSFNSPF